MEIYGSRILMFTLLLVSRGLVGATDAPAHAPAHAPDLTSRQQSEYTWDNIVSWVYDVFGYDISSYSETTTTVATIPDTWDREDSHRATVPGRTNTITLAAEIPTSTKATVMVVTPEIIPKTTVLHEADTTIPVIETTTTSPLHEADTTIQVTETTETSTEIADTTTTSDPDQETTTIPAPDITKTSTADTTSMSTTTPDTTITITPVPETTSTSSPVTETTTTTPAADPTITMTPVPATITTGPETTTENTTMIPVTTFEPPVSETTKTTTASECQETDGTTCITTAAVPETTSVPTTSQDDLDNSSHYPEVSSTTETYAGDLVPSTTGLADLLNTTLPEDNSTAPADDPIPTRTYDHIFANPRFVVLVLTPVVTFALILCWYAWTLLYSSFRRCIRRRNIRRQCSKNNKVRTNSVEVLI